MPLSGRPTMPRVAKVARVESRTLLGLLLARVCGFFSWAADY